MRCRYFVSLVPFLLLSACIGMPQSQSALSAPGEADYDPRLIGSWVGVLRGHDTKGVLALFEIAPRKDGLVSVAALWSQAGAAPERQVDWVQWVGAIGHASNLDGRTYYNLRLVSGNLEILPDAASAESDAPPSYVILQAEIDPGDRLFLRFMAPKAVDRWIKEGSVRGHTVSCGEYCEYSKLQLSRSELIALVRKADPDELWTAALGPFHRVDSGIAAIDFRAWSERLIGK